MVTFLLSRGDESGGHAISGQALRYERSREEERLSIGIYGDEKVVVQIMELLMLGGLLLVVVSTLIAAARRSSADESLRQPYVINGLVLAFFAMGAFIVGRGLIGAVPADTIGAGYMTIGGWIFAVPLILAFLFGFSSRKVILQAIPVYETGGVDSQVDHQAKLHRPSFRTGVKYSRMGA